MDTPSTHTVTSDGIILSRIDYLRNVLKQCAERKESVSVHSVSHGLPAFAQNVTIRRVDEAGVELYGKVAMAMPQQGAEPFHGTYYVAFVDIVRVMQSSGIALTAQS